MTEDATVFDVFARSVARYGARSFIQVPAETAKIYDLEKADYTYEEASLRIAALIASYDAAGVGVNVRIGLVLENRPEFFLHFLALNSLGASILPLNIAMQDNELRYQIEHSECALIVADSAYVVRLEEIVKTTPAQPSVVASDKIAGATTISSAKFAEKDARAREAAILYTSGTTGQPKGCILSNDYFLAIGEFYTSLGGYISFDEGGERIITPLPVTHMNALAVSFMSAIKTGSCLIQLDRFHPKSWQRTVKESHATIMHYLGVMPAMLLAAQESEEDNLKGQIKFAFGAGCDPKHHERFEKRFGVKLIEAWAMTETGAGAWITASHEPRHVGTRCFGKAPKGLEVRLVDENGCDVPVGGAGELLVRQAGANPRAHFFSGYFKDETATEEVWKEGWFHTGDAVRQDEDGFFYFVDRLKNVIRRSGENIAAIDVESVLMRHPAVASCVVAPVPDEMRGDEVAALIVTTASRDEKTARAIFDFALDNLIYFKAPGYIAFVDSIAVTASEKVKRREAKERARVIVKSGEAFDFNPHKKAKR
ncbi:MAG: AMP-binding protein [Parvularculaceae bacterium]